MRLLRTACVAAAAVFPAVWLLWTAPAWSQARTLCVHDVEPPNSLSVHASASSAAAVVGQFAAKACGIKLTGPCVGDWCQMSLGNQSGWVDSRFVAYYDVPEGYKVEAPAAQPAAKVDAPAPRKAEGSGKSAAKRVATSEPRRSPQKTAARPEREAKNKAHRSSSSRVAESKRHHSRTVWHPPVERSSLQVGFGFGSFFSGTFGTALRSLLGGPPIAYGYPKVLRTRPRMEHACVRRVEPGDVLYIRSGPGVGNEATGGIPPGACGIERRGGCQGPWCRVAWRGRTGWVNAYYLD